MASAMTESPFHHNALQGEVALITGGGSGIGLEIARQFGRHGAKVALMGRRQAVLDDAAAQLRAEGIAALPLAGDVRRPEDAQRVVTTTVEQWGRLDVLVNGAAGNFLVPTEDLSVNGFRTVLDIDAVGTFCMCQAARPFLALGGSPARADATSSAGSVRRPQLGGLILNISATLHYTAKWYQVHVAAAKAAVDATMRNMALEWAADFGIRVNAIAPGPVSGTPGMDKLLPREMRGGNHDELLAQAIPTGRNIFPRDIALAAVFLASSAGACINGATIVVDGGNWLMTPKLAEKEVIRSVSRAVERRSRKVGDKRTADGEAASPNAPERPKSRL